MAKGTSKSAGRILEGSEDVGEYDKLHADLFEAEHRVLKIQAKLHRWAGDDAHRRFDDLFCRG